MDYSNERRVRSIRELSIVERHEMIEEYLSGGHTKQSIWQKYTGQPTEHGKMLVWMRKYGYLEDQPKRRSIFTSTNHYPLMSKDHDEMDPSALRLKIRELEKQLQEAKLKEEGYRTMIEVAEQTFKIPIRKKSDTK